MSLRLPSSLRACLNDYTQATRMRVGTVKYYAQIHLQVWQNSVYTGQGNLPLIT